MRVSHKCLLNVGEAVASMQPVTVHLGSSPPPSASSNRESGASYRRWYVSVFVTHRVMLLIAMFLVRHIDVHVIFVAQRQPPAFGNPNLPIGIYVYILSFRERVVHRRGFTVDLLIAEIAAAVFAVLPVFPLLLHHLLGRPSEANPPATSLQIRRPAGIDCFRVPNVLRPRLAPIFGNISRDVINVSRRGDDLVHSGVYRVIITLGDKGYRAKYRNPKC